MPGIGLRFQVDGVDNLLHGLERMFAAETRVAPMERLRQRLLARLTNYPPPTGGTYERTGKLGRAWAESGAVRVDAVGTNQFADQVSVELHNQVEGPDGRPYAGWVQDENMQARVHRGRWTTAQEALAAETGPFLSDLSSSLEDAFGR